jgi:ankyrin repeat protein
VNGDATEKKERQTNGVDKRENGHSKTAAGSKKSRSSHDVGSATSRAQSADASTSPQDVKDRAREAHSAEPRKRKFSDSHRPSKLEPPRQRPRLDDSKANSKTLIKTRQHSPPTPATPGIRAHKRSASTQSSLPTGTSSGQSRKRREASTTTVTSDRKEWNSDSSSSNDDDSSPHRPPPIPNLAPPLRSSRSTQRALHSPARAMPKQRADKYGVTPLARACERGILEAVKRAFEEAPEELDRADNGGFSPLQKAALNGYADIVQFLLDKGCRRNVFDKNERDTPLIDAVDCDHVEIVEILLKSGVNPHHQNKNGKRAIDAINEDKQENAAEMKELIQQAMQDYDGSEEEGDDQQEQPVSMRDATNRPDLLYLEANLRNLLDYSRKGDSVAVGHFLASVKPDIACAVAAARGGHEVVLNLLLASDSDKLEKDPDPKHYDETPLTAAIGRGHLKVIRLLLDQENFNPTRKTKDNKTYYELAEEVRGPRWQAESELLKERYDAYSERKKVVQEKKKKRKDPEANNGTAEVSPRVPKAPESPKAAKQKRLLSRKELPKEKDSKRRSRPVLPDSSQSEGSDNEVRIAKPPARKRKGSMASKSSKDGPTSPVGTRHPSAGRPRASTDPKATKNSLKTSHSKRQKITSSDVDMDDADAEPVEPVRQETPEAVRESRRKEAEAKAAEEAAKITEAERLKREAEEAAAREAERKAEEERLLIEKQKREREERLESLPLALRVAVEKGADRPLHFTLSTKAAAGRLGISAQFLPIYLVAHKDLDPKCEDAKKEDEWMMSFQAVGILGLPSELHLKEFPAWEKQPVTDEQREFFLQDYDISQLAKEYQWPEAGEQGYNEMEARNAIKDAREKLKRLKPLDWIRFSDFKDALAMPEYKHLAKLDITTSKSCRVRERSVESSVDMFGDWEAEGSSIPAPVPVSVPAEVKDEEVPTAAAAPAVTV